MIKNRDIIVVGIQPWDISIGSNCKNIAVEFSKQNRVLYVNSPLDFISAIKGRKDPKVIQRKRIIEGKEDDLVQIDDNLWNLNPRTKLLSINKVSFNSLFDFLNKRNNKSFAKQIQSAIASLGFKDYIIFNDSDMFRSFHLKEILKPKTYVYYTRDNLIAVDYWKKQGVRIEAEHMRKSDIVLGNSTYLAKQAEKFNKYSFYVGQGCDLSNYNPDQTTKIPADIENIKKPIIGYIGALKSLRLDIDIIEHIAVENKEWSIVLIGPEDEDFKTSKLHQLDNVFFLGNKDENDLSNYLNVFDVAINPQKLNPITIGNYPRKIDEYLVMGKATVATKTEAMSVFKDYTYLAENKYEYIELIETALKENSEELIHERMNFAGRHTWENNVKKIYHYIMNFEALSNL